MGPAQYEIIAITLDALSTTFALTVVVFLIVAGRKEKTLRSGFYVLFIVLTIVECLRAVSVGHTWRNRSVAFMEGTLGSPNGPHKAKPSTEVTPAAGPNSQAYGKPYTASKSN